MYQQKSLDNFDETPMLILPYPSWLNSAGLQTL